MQTNPESAAFEAVARYNINYTGMPQGVHHSDDGDWVKFTDHQSALDALRGEVRELTADRDSWREQASERVADWDKERQRADAAERRVAELEAVLRPLADANFAEFCGEGTEANEPDDSKVSYPEDRCHITFGMIRNARKALTKESP